MIERTAAFKTSDGKTHGTLAGAQQAELEILFNPQTDAIEDVAKQVISMIVEQSEKVIDILTTSETSRPKARKVNGGSKKRTSKTATDTIAV